MAVLDTFIERKPSVSMLGTEVVKSEIELTFSAETVAAASDTVGVMRLPAGAVVSQLLVNVKTAEGGVATIDLGIRGGTATQFANDLNVNAVAATFSTTPDYVNVSGSEQIVELLANNELNAAVVQVIAVYSISELALS